jgi:hypothetical protein
MDFCLGKIGIVIWVIQRMSVLINAVDLLKKLLGNSLKDFVSRNFLFSEVAVTVKGANFLQNANLLLMLLSQQL